MVLATITAVLWHGLRDALLMAWEVLWALVLGFAVSALVQAWVPRERVQAALGQGGPRTLARATALGAASSSCSYAAVAIGKSLFQKGASAAGALAFQFAATNLVWELGLVLWTLIGWQFALAEYLGGLVMIAVMAALLRLFVSPALERAARAHAREADAGHHHHHGAAEEPEPMSWRARLRSASAWSEVARYFRSDWQMLYREIGLGLLIAGFVAQLGNGVFAALFIRHAPAPLPALENAIVGPLIAVASFVCSVGNVPLAAVLWSGGITFGGVLAFLFADLIVLPILVIYRRLYGAAFAIRITALMFVAMVLAGLIVDGLFSLAGAVPRGPRPGRAEVVSAVRLDGRLALNVLAVVVFAVLWSLTVRGEGREPAGAMATSRE